MDMALWLKLVAILALVVGNAFFVASEISLTSARRSRIKQLADMGNRSARVVQTLHNEPERFYSVTQIGITLVSLALGAIGMETVGHLLDPGFQSLFQAVDETSPHATVLSWAHTASYGVGFLVISFLHVVGGELAPKVYAFHNAESLSLLVGRIINGLYRLLAWLIWIMNKSAQGLLWLFGQRELIRQEGGVHFSMTEEEIRTILSASEREGVINPEETKMIRHVFDLDDHTTREAMIPRTDIVAVSEGACVGDVLKRFQGEHHERFPVFSGSLDDIVGFVTMKGLLDRLAQGESLEAVLNQQVTEIMLPPYIVPDTKPLSHLLKEFQEKSRYMAVVIDEFGGTAGIITLEDILEEIVGEYDDESTKRDGYIKKTGPSEYIVEAAIRVAELGEEINFPFPESEDYATLGGLIYTRLDRVPEVGDRIELDGGRIEVVEMDRHRIALVKFQDLALDERGQTRLAEEVTPEEHKG
jgi:CBS domain containing-hemolysin-like protein